MKTLLLVSLLSFGCVAARDEAPVAHTLAFDVDPAAARALGWTAPDASDERARTAALEHLRSALAHQNLEVEANLSNGGELTVGLPEGMDASERERVRRVVQCAGARLAFSIVATPEDFANLDLLAERERLHAWRQAHPGADIARFNLVARDAGGPDARVRWCDVSENYRRLTEVSEPLLVLARALPEGFSELDIEDARTAEDGTGHYALAFELKAPRRAAFERFTEEHVGRSLAILADGKVWGAPVLSGPLPGAGVVQGRFTQTEAEALQRLFTGDEERGVFREI